MTYPVDVATVVVTGSFTSTIPGQIATGYVYFTPSTVLVDSGTGAVVEPGTLTVLLDATGSFSATLMATDDAHLTPTGWTYLVQETVAGQPIRRYYLPFPTGGPYSLGYRAPLATPPVTTAFVPLSAQGAANGVATLDSTKIIPVGQLANAVFPTVTLTRDATGAVASYVEAGQTVTLTRDTAGRITTMTRAGTVRAVSRDAAGRLTGVA